MTIAHHPCTASLMSCAAGSQPEAQAAVIASHISMCPQCCAELKRLEAVGAALFEGIAPDPVTKACPVAAARALEAEAGEPVRMRSPAKGNCPYPLLRVLDLDLDTLEWRRLAPGIWSYPIPLSPGAKGDLRLIKVAPGKALPEHGHCGEELTLLLAGSYTDESGTFRRGDVADLDNDQNHRPVADPKEGCICLVASEGKARVKGLFARMMQAWMRL